MKKYDTLEHIRIEKLIFGGSGLATAPDGRKIIVSGGAIPEAVVDLRITKVKNNRIEAQILRTVTRSPLEQDIRPEWQLYGGCKWLPIPYDEQLRIKEAQVKEAFHNIDTSSAPLSGGEGVGVRWHSIIPSPQSEHYRNKVEFSWGKYISAKEGIHDEYRFGFHVQGQFDRIENCRYCVLADEETNAIFQDVDVYARSSGFPTYDPKTAVGFWRHLVIRRGGASQETMLIFSVNSLWDPASDIGIFFTDMVRQLSEKYPHLASVYFLENTGRADIVMGNAILLSGKPSIDQELLGLRFEIQPKSFFQVNSLGAEKLYQCVIDSIQHKGGTLLDLYAGTGTIGILLARYFGTVYSVELVLSASQDGIKNSNRNGIKNVEFLNAKVEDFAREFAAAKKKADTIILDPPRDGLHPSAIPYILEFGALEIIYVSCNPATLVRDIGLMLGTKEATESTEAGETTIEGASGKAAYRITDITPVDMFPHTHHIETVVRLEKI